MADVLGKRSLEEAGPGPGAGGDLALKKQKLGEGALAPAAVQNGVRRTSGLLAPIMLLTGHGGEVFTLKYSPDGDVLASGSHDKHIFLWRTYGECENFMSLKGHKNAILELHWTTDGERIVSASPDKTVRMWDVVAGEQVKKMTEHDNFVNSCHTLRRGPPLIVSGSDDGTVKVWDVRQKRSVQTLTERYQVTAVAWADAGDQVYSAGVENLIQVWDLRKAEVVLQLTGHSDSITGLRVSPDGTHLLSNAMDNTLRVWDMRPYAPANRCTKVFTGHAHNFEKNLLKCDWSPDGSQGSVYEMEVSLQHMHGQMVTAGSGDRMVYIWDTASQRLLYKLPGHTGSVNDVVFHPKEPVVASGASDKNIYQGELSVM